MIELFPTTTTTTIGVVIIIIIIMNNNTNIRQSQWHITNDAKILSGNQIQFYLYVS